MKVSLPPGDHKAVTLCNTVMSKLRKDQTLTPELRTLFKNAYDATLIVRRHITKTKEKAV